MRAPQLARGLHSHKGSGQEHIDSLSARKFEPLSIHQNLRNFEPKVAAYSLPTRLQDLRIEPLLKEAK